jgi:hypothetical protein
MAMELKSHNIRVRLVILINFVDMVLYNLDGDFLLCVNVVTMGGIYRI